MLRLSSFSSRRSRRCVAVLGAAALTAVSLTTAAVGQETSAVSRAAGPLAGSAALSQRESVRVPGNVRFYQERTSLLGRHRWYQQLANGHVVVGGWYAVHLWNDGTTTVWDGRKNVRGLAKTPATISADAAAKHVDKVDAAATLQTDTDGLMVLPSDDGRPAQLVWRVVGVDGSGVTASYVDATTGVTLETEQLAKNLVDPQGLGRLDRRAPAHALVTGRARVFDPNPVVALQREGLRDRRDANTAVPRTAYRIVDLPRLRHRHTLVGRFVRIVNPDRATSAVDRYFFLRHNDRFEQVNAYYAVDAEQAYLHRLGFTDVNADAQDVATDAFPDDNSFYNPADDLISLGTGGVDDAEDPEVIWHEYGHAIQDDQVPDFGRSFQAAAMGEGFGDYMAVVTSQLAPHPNDTSRTPAACVMDWDSTSYTTDTPHCLRRTDTDLHYPEDLHRVDPHFDGQIWSGALWDLAQALGQDKATMLVVEAQFAMNPAIAMPAAARAVVATTTALSPGDAATTRQVFVDRGILPSTS
ncbi:MAG TPA: M36 family metallopeptidase [Nocardioidaceae bacterium]